MPDIEMLYRLHRIVVELDIDIDYVLLGRGGRHHEAESDRVISRLKAAELYDEARAFATAANLSADNITVDQVLLLQFSYSITMMQNNYL